MTPNILIAITTTTGVIVGALVSGVVTLIVAGGKGKFELWQNIRQDNETLSKNLAACRTEVDALRGEIRQLRVDMRKFEEGQERAESACRACVPLYEAVLVGVIPDRNTIVIAGRELREAGFEVTLPSIL